MSCIVKNKSPLKGKSFAKVMLFASSIVLTNISLASADGYNIKPHVKDVIISKQKSHVIIRDDNNHHRQHVYQSTSGPRNVISLANNPSTLPSVTLQPNRFGWINNSSPYSYGYNSPQQSMHQPYGGGAYYDTNYVNSYPHSPYQTPPARGSTIRYKAAVPRESGENQLLVPLR